MLRYMNRTVLLEKINEAMTSVIPVTIVVLILCFTIAPVPAGALLAFATGAVFLIVGMGLFTLGAETAMSPIGEYVGAWMTKTRKIWIIISVSLFVGIMITVSEPDLHVLASQVPDIPSFTLIITVAVGVGIFLVTALLRVIFGFKLSYMLIIFYVILIAIAFFSDVDFLSVAFDSGGVTTGPMTVPFIMALGVGVSLIRSDKEAGSDSFGFVALCSVGPILAVLILGMIFSPEESVATSIIIPDITDSKELWSLFRSELPKYFKEVAIALAPVAGFFTILQIFTLKIKKRPFIKILIGILYTYFGLVLFLAGVNVGFMPVGNYIGKLIGELEYNWILVPLGMLIGYFIVAAEPAVHVLNKQVEDITAGAIPQSAMSKTLAIGVSVSVGLAMIRVLTALPILYILVPGYLIALILTFFVPPIFTSIAFDSGGVASGPMTATFLLPFAMGACDAVGGNIITDAFGVVAMVAMTPLIAIQIMGIVYKIRIKNEENKVLVQKTEAEEIIQMNIDNPGNEPPVFHQSDNKPIETVADDDILDFTEKINFEHIGEDKK